MDDNDDVGEPILRRPQNFQSFTNLVIKSEGKLHNVFWGLYPDYLWVTMVVRMFWRVYLDITYISPSDFQTVLLVSSFHQFVLHRWRGSGKYKTLAISNTHDQQIWNSFFLSLFLLSSFFFLVFHSTIFLEELTFEKTFWTG